MFARSIDPVKLSRRNMCLRGSIYNDVPLYSQRNQLAEIIHIEDNELARLCARGDDEARNELYTRYAENAENLSKAIKNFEAMTANLSRVTQGMAKPIENISKSAESMHRVMGEIEEAKIAAKAGEDLDILKQKLDAIDTKAMNENLTKAMESISQLSKRLDGMVYKNQDQVGDAVVELNAVLENLEE